MSNPLDQAALAERLANLTHDPGVASDLRAIAARLRAEAAEGGPSDERVSTPAPLDSQDAVVPAATSSAMS